MRVPVFVVIFMIGFVMLLPQVQAEPAVSIIMEKTTYVYCEKLFYTIKVSGITGNPAIIHIIDETGKESSAIPIPILELENPIPSLIPFEAEIFPLGKYVVDVQYSGATDSAEFELVESDSICIPERIKPIANGWLAGVISDGFLVESIQRYVDETLIDVPFTVNEENVYDVNIPEWIKQIGGWWLQGTISDDEFSNAMNYLLKQGVIGVPEEKESQI